MKILREALKDILAACEGDEDNTSFSPSGDFPEWVRSVAGNALRKETEHWDSWGMTYELATVVHKKISHLQNYDHWGYGWVDIQVEAEKTAGLIERYLDERFDPDEGCPGVAAYELNLEKFGPVNIDDPISWLQNLQKNSYRLVNEWYDSSENLPIGDYRLFRVVVGNIGEVYEGHNGTHAKDLYKEYAGMSQKSYGKVSGEQVTLFADGEPIKTLL